MGRTTISNENEALAVTSSYQTLFTQDVRTTRDNVISFYNTHATSGMLIKIYGSLNGEPIPADADDSWFNILNVASDITPTTYDHNLEVTIPAETPWYESFSNKWAWIRIEIKSSTGTLTGKIWFRGSPYA